MGLMLAGDDDGVKESPLSCLIQRSCKGDSQRELYDSHCQSQVLNPVTNHLSVIPSEKYDELKDRKKTHTQ